MHVEVGGKRGEMTLACTIVCVSVDSQHKPLLLFLLFLFPSSFSPSLPNLSGLDRSNCGPSMNGQVRSKLGGGKRGGGERGGERVQGCGLVCARCVSSRVVTVGENQGEIFRVERVSSSIFVFAPFLT